MLYNMLPAAVARISDEIKNVVTNSKNRLKSLAISYIYHISNLKPLF